VTRAGRYVGARAHTSIMQRQQQRQWSRPVHFDRAERLVAAEMERRGARPERDDEGRVRSAMGKRVEVALVGPDNRGYFRSGGMRPSTAVVIFTDCRGRFWLATADEVREAQS
jgi:hypothetical protein